MILTLFCSFSFAPKNTIKSCETESLSTLDRLVTALSLLVCMVCACVAVCVSMLAVVNMPYTHIYTATTNILLLTFILLFGVVLQIRIAAQRHCNGLRFASFSALLHKSQSCSSSSDDISFLNFRLVVSSLEALENCFAVGSSSEKVRR